MAILTDIDYSTDCNASFYRLTLNCRTNTS